MSRSKRHVDWAPTQPGFWQSMAEQYAASDHAREAEAEALDEHRGHRGRTTNDLFFLCEECFLRKLRAMLRAPHGSHQRNSAERLADQIAAMGIRPLKGSMDRYVVPSRTRRGIYYTVTVAGDRAACTCRGARLDYIGADGWHAGRCYHEEKVMTLSETMREVVPYEDRASLLPVPVQPSSRLYPTPDEMTVITAICRAAPYAAGKFLPKELSDPGSAMIVALAGHALGLPPVIAFQHIYIIEGRLMPSAQVLMGVIRANVPGVEFEWLQFDQKGCRVRITAPGRRTIEASYTEEDALRAGQLRYARREDGAENKGMIVSGEKRSTAWNTHRPLMMAYNAVRTAMKLEYIDVMLQVAPRLGSAMTEPQLLAREQDALLPEPDDLVGIDMAADGDLAGIPWDDKIETGRRLVAEMGEAGASREQLLVVLAGQGIGAWLRENPTKGLRDLAREAAQIPVVDMPEASEDGAETPPQTAQEPAGGEEGEDRGEQPSLI